MITFKGTNDRFKGTHDDSKVTNDHVKVRNDPWELMITIRVLMMIPLRVLMITLRVRMIASPSSSTSSASDLITRDSGSENARGPWYLAYVPTYAPSHLDR